MHAKCWHTGRCMRPQAGEHICDDRRPKRMHPIERCTPDALPTDGLANHAFILHAFPRMRLRNGLAQSPECGQWTRQPTMRGSACKCAHLQNTRREQRPHANRQDACAVGRTPIARIMQAMCMHQENRPWPLNSHKRWFFPRPGPCAVGMSSCEQHRHQRHGVIRDMDENAWPHRPVSHA